MDTCKLNVKPFLIVQSNHKSYDTDRGVQLKTTVYAFIAADSSLILTILNQPLI